MTLGEIIALAKAGYKKQDIDDLLKIKVDEPEPDPDPGADPISTEPDNGSKGDPVASPEDDPDFENLYNELKSEFDKLKNELLMAQEKNRKENHGSPDPEPDLDDVFRAYM